jgi:histidyl-tRNA synthetase
MDQKQQTIIQPRRLKGFQDYEPAVMWARQYFAAIIRRQAVHAGFQEIGTPALEYAETLLGQGSDETDKEVYKFKDHGERDVALRFDLTVPFARWVAENQGTLTLPFKRLQIGDVWRGEKPQKGRFREFTQCDFDIVGVDSEAADLEILLTLASTLAAFDCGAFTITVGHRPILSRLIQSLICSGPAENAVLVAIDKLAKIGLEKTCALIVEKTGCPLDQAKALISLAAPEAGQTETNLQKVLTALPGDSSVVAPFVHAADRARRLVSEVSQGRVRLRVDLSLARGLGYYTGIVFEMHHDELPGFGSVGGGGRYDGLVSRFSTRALSGVGGSIGLDRLVSGLAELGRLPPLPRPAAFVAVATPDAIEVAASVTGRLRRAGIIADFGMSSGKVAAQFKHADRLGAALVVILGTDEVARAEFSLKDMRDGSQVQGLPLAELEKVVTGRLTPKQP